MDLFRFLHNIKFLHQESKEKCEFTYFCQSCRRHPCYQTKSSRNDHLNRKIERAPLVFQCIIILLNKSNRICKFWMFHQKWKWKVITVIWISHVLYGTVEVTYNIVFWRNKDDSYDNQVTGMHYIHAPFSVESHFFFFKNLILSLQQTVLNIVNANECLQVLNTFSVLVLKHSF